MPNRAIATGVLGYAWLEQGDFREAEACLDESLRLMCHLHLPRLHSFFMVLHSEVALAQGQYQQARERAAEGLALASETQYRVVIAWAQRTLGKLAMTQGTLDEATTLSHQALAHFAAISARFEMGRTHLVLAELAHLQSQPKTVHHHFRTAYEIWDTLGVPTHMARLRQQAPACGIVCDADGGLTPV